MPSLQRAVASLRIGGAELEPEEISRLLRVRPTHAQRKGQELPSKSSPTPRIAKSGLWRLKASDTEPENLDSQVAELLAKCNATLGVWQTLATKYEIDLFCGWFMGGGNEGVEISPKTLLALGQRGIRLSLDIYGPDTDA